MGFIENCKSYYEENRVDLNVVGAFALGLSLLYAGYYMGRSDERRDLIKREVEIEQTDVNRMDSSNGFMDDVWEREGIAINGSIVSY